MSDNVQPLFTELGLAPPLLQVVAEVGYETPSPIQAQSIPPLLAGRDLLGQAQTGTGKTAAFALPLLSRLDVGRAAPQVLVLTPTRELAIQVAEAMQTYARHLPGFHVLPVYGGQAMGQQLRMLARGVQVVVGTPGRTLDHLRRKTLRLDALQTVVLDEADEMLRMGFIDDVEAILEQAPEQTQIALFSATMPAAIQQIARRFLKQPVEIRIKSRTSTVETIRQRYWPVDGLHKLDALTRILEAEVFDGMIVFVRTKLATEELAGKLEARGYAAAALNGDMNQALREKTVERMKGGALDILVATDVAARGLDVERISHVINYDIPNDTEAYVHRIGRTGRAGRTGEAILFVTPRERRMLRMIEQATRQQIEPMALPTRQQIADRRIEAFKQAVSETLEQADLSPLREVVLNLQRESEVDLETLAAALAYRLQQDRPLHPTEAEIPEPKSRRQRDDRATAGPRAERPDRARGGGDSRDLPPLQRYRIEVGREHGVEPRNIVGAIANEAGLESRYIGRIRLFDGFSTIELPEGMPKEVFRHLQKVWICGRQLQIRLDTGPDDAPSDAQAPYRARPERPFRRSGPAPRERRSGRPGGPAGRPKRGG